jgi:FixJ family two-component response regulator
MTQSKGIEPIIYVVDDDGDLGAAVARLLRRQGFSVEPFVDPASLLSVYHHAPASCVITDIMMAEMDGFAFAERLREIDPAAAIIFMTAWPTTANAVDAVRRYGGLDYLEKPIDEERLLAAIAEGVAWNRRRSAAIARLQRITPRERDVFDLLVRGLSNKAVAAELDISPKTVEDHRAAIMAKTGATNLAHLVELAKNAF